MEDRQGSEKTRKPAKKSGSGRGAHHLDADTQCISGEDKQRSRPGTKKTNSAVVVNKVLLPVLSFI